MSASNYVTIHVEEILGETERALLVLLDDGEEVWLPLSQIADSEDYRAGDVDVDLSITEYIARQKGLET